METRNLHTKHRRFVQASLVLILLMTMALGACSRPVPKPELVLNPKVVAQRQVTGDLYTRERGQAISPDGKYLLAEQRDAQGVRMVAVSLDSAAAKDVVFATVDPVWTSDNYVSLPPIGWTSPTTCIFLVSGRQSQGPHKDKTGVAIMSADVTKPGAEETGFIELQQGYFHSATFVAERSKLYLHVSRALWEFDFSQKALRLVKGDLPTYDSLFYIRISPTGEYAVYDLHEADKDGLYIVETATGKERPLLPTGETMSFLPQWSPDGKYIAVYTAKQKPGAADLPIWERYQVYQGEDSLLPIASEITVMDPQGTVQKSIKVAGKTLAYATWAQNSTTIGFMAGVPRPPITGDDGFPSDQRPSAVSYDSAMLADVPGTSQEAVRVADLQSLPELTGSPSVNMAFVVPSGKGLFFNAFTEEKAEFWYASRDLPPAKISDGSWQFYGVEPVYEDSIVGVVSFGSKSAVRLTGSQGSLMSQFDHS